LAALGAGLAAAVRVGVIDMAMTCSTPDSHVIDRFWSSLTSVHIAGRERPDRWMIGAPPAVTVIRLLAGSLRGVRGVAVAADLGRVAVFVTMVITPAKTM
jgi:hypothetical protein